MMYRYIVYITCFLFVNFINAQNIEWLHQKKNQNEKDLIYIQNLLKNTRKDKRIRLGKLQLINNKINIRQNLIKNIKQEISLLDESIDNDIELVNDLEVKLKFLKTAYAATINYAYKHRNYQDKLMFILSSQNFNQAYRRLRYLKQYRDFSRSQVQEITQTRDIINTRIQKIKENRFTKNELLKKQKNETNTLTKEKQQQSVYVNKLRAKEKKLKEDLKKQRKLAAKLDKKIRNLIAKDVKKSKSRDGKIRLTPQQQKLSGSFANNKGKLPWPTMTGYISSPFGEQQHPVLKHVKIRNDGVDITTEKGAVCKAVFDGIVSEISTLPGLNNIVILRHGKYLTIYVNLVDISVRKGTKIKRGKKLGTIFTNTDEGKTVLKFQLWEGFNKLNPASWLHKQ